MNPPSNKSQSDNNSFECSMVGYGVGFQKIRRITGYLVGDWRKRFNDAKRSEVDDRVSHVVVS